MVYHHCFSELLFYQQGFICLSGSVSCSLSWGSAVTHQRTVRSLPCKIKLQLLQEGWQLSQPLLQKTHAAWKWKNTAWWGECTSQLMLQHFQHVRCGCVHVVGLLQEWQWKSNVTLAERMESLPIFCLHHFSDFYASCSKTVWFLKLVLL